MNKQTFDGHTHMKSNLLKNLSLLSIICLSSVVFLGKSYETTIGSIDASIYSYAALDMTSEGLKPKLPPKLLNINQHLYTFNDSPFTQIYLEGLIMRAIGANAWSSKLLSALFSVGCVLMIIWIGTLLVHFEFGLIAGLILLFTRHFIMWNANFHLDAGMIFFILLGYAFWIKNKPLASGVFTGISLWMKTPVGLLILPATFISLLVSKKDSKRWKSFFILVISTILVGSVIWILTGLFGHWGLVKDYWVRQIFGTAVEGRGVGHSDYIRFWSDLIKFYPPWSLCLLFSGFWIIKNKKWNNHLVVLSVISVLVVYFTISSIRFQNWYYYLPAYPFLALLSAYGFQNVALKHSQKLQVGLISFSLLCSTFLLTTPVSLGPEKLPALASFTPYIQSEGNCDDQVLLIRGLEPYGGDINFMYYINFYTGKKVLPVFCPETKSALQDPSVRWILVSGEHFETCLDEQTKTRFKTQLLYGNQYLLSQYSFNVKGAFNLTPLERMRKAPIDCQKVPISSNPYLKITHEAD